MKDLFSLQGRVALVTGGSRGIGRMIATGFLHHGVKVYISARKAAACEATAEELSAIGPCVPLPADVSTVEGARALAAQVMEREPSLDILVNNAGAAWGEAFDTFPESGWDKVVDLNMKAPFFLTQALHAHLRKAATAQRPAKVINIASIDGISVNQWETYSYTASKAGLIHLTRRMALRLAQDGIVVNGIAPGPLRVGHEQAGARPRRRGGAAGAGGPDRASRRTWPAPPSSWRHGRAISSWARRSWWTAGVTFARGS
jgi:NAD(P)-dependent dehydrogenase (short-subunit alcohol dehydrogenase family)